MTTIKPKLEQLALLELARKRGNRARSGYPIIAAYIQATMEIKNEGLDDAIDRACRKYKISDRTARTAWKQSRTLLNKKAVKRAIELEDERIAKRAATEAIKRERAKRTATK